MLFIFPWVVEVIAHVIFRCIFRDRGVMPVGRRGLVVPQNTFLENVIRRSNGLRKYLNVGLKFQVGTNFLLTTSR